MFPATLLRLSGTNEGCPHLPQGVGHTHLIDGCLAILLSGRGEPTQLRPTRVCPRTLSRLVLYNCRRSQPSLACAQMSMSWRATWYYTARWLVAPADCSCTLPRLGTIHADSSQLLQLAFRISIYSPAHIEEIRFGFVCVGLNVHSFLSSLLKFTRLRAISS